MQIRLCLRGEYLIGPVHALQRLLSLMFECVQKAQSFIKQRHGDFFKHLSCIVEPFLLALIPLRIRCTDLFRAVMQISMHRQHLIPITFEFRTPLFVYLAGRIGLQPFSQGALSRIGLDFKFVPVLKKGIADLVGPFQMVHFPHSKQTRQPGIGLYKDLADIYSRYVEFGMGFLNVFQQPLQLGNQTFSILPALAVEPHTEPALFIIGLHMQLGHRLIRQKGINLGNPVQMVHFPLNHLAAKLVALDDLARIPHDPPDAEDRPQRHDGQKADYRAKAGKKLKAD